MRFLRLVLLPLLATGLLAAPGVQRHGRAGDEGTPAWSNARHDHEAAVIDSRAEALSARPPDERVPRTSSDGDAPPPAAAPAQRRVVLCCAAARGLSVAACDGRIPLAQFHVRVNGSANAHGARA